MTDLELARTASALVGRLPGGVRLRGVTYDPARGAAWATWLSEAEAARRRSFGAAKRRREFLAGRAAARSLLAEALGCAPGAVPLRTAPDGGVDVAAGDWRLSIAHSGPHAVAAADRRPVGVDLEAIKPRNPDLAGFLFARGEREVPARLPYGESASLVLCWALKEAVLKARRSGFRLSPKKLRLRVARDRRRAVVRIEAPQDEVQGEAQDEAPEQNAGKEGEEETWRLEYARVSGAEAGARAGAEAAAAETIDYWLAVATPHRVNEGLGDVGRGRAE
jgi:4'-phosphopantetheinyl transferase